MNIIEWILKSLGLREETESEKYVDKIRQIETKKAEFMLRRAREMDKPDPNHQRIDLYDREIKKWEELLEKAKKEKDVKISRKE